MIKRQISLLKETRGGEKRVLLLPDATRAFSEQGFQVLVESEAGLLAGVDDSAYQAAGCEIVSTKEAWSLSDIVLKYKAPSPDEYQYFRDDLHLACFFHAEGNETLANEMLNSGMWAYALEFMETAPNEWQVPASDNEIAGKLAVILASYHLQSHLGGSGTLLSSVPGANRARVVVIGHGNAGGAAALLAASMGADVVVFGAHHDNLRRFEAKCPPNIQCFLNTPDKLKEEVLRADVVIGAILISTYDTPPMIDEHMVREMKSGSVMVDVTCGYGSGYLPTFHKLTTYDDPFYVVHGVLHCKIDAMPASVPATATAATSYNVLPYVLYLCNQLVDNGPPKAARNDLGLLLGNKTAFHHELIRHLEHRKNSQ